MFTSAIESTDRGRATRGKQTWQGRSYYAHSNGSCLQ